MAQSKRVDPKKIEKAAVLAVKNLIQPCETVDDKLDDDDKNILVDGSLELYSSPELTIENFVGKVDVQIKGTTRKLSVNKRGYVKYQVEVVGLRRYLEVFHGILFFCVSVAAPQGYPVGKSVYYAQLLPYDITQILSATRADQKSVTVPFGPFPTEPKEITRLLQAFNAERERQLKAKVSGYGFLDKNFELPPEIKSFNFSMQLFPGEPVTTLGSLREGPYIYGEDQEGHFTVFGKMHDVSAFAMGVEAEVGSGAFTLRTTVFSGQSEEGEFLEFEGVRMYLLKEKARIDYTVSGGIRSRYNTVRFMYEFSETGRLSIDGKTAILADVEEFDETQRKRLSESLDVYGRMVETLDTLHIRADWDPSEMSDKELNDIGFMWHLFVERKPLTNQKLESPLVHFDIQDAYVFALANELEDGSYEFRNLFADDLFFVFGGPDPETGEPKYTSDPVPPLVALGEEGYRRVVNLVPEEVEKAFDRLPITPSNQDPLNQKLLEMLAAYDKGCQQPEELLASAAIVAKRLYEADSSSETYLLNLMQTFKRKRVLESDERKRLQDVAIDSERNYVKAAAYALLDDMDMARNCLNRCIEDERKQIEDYPISRFFDRGDNGASE